MNNMAFMYGMGEGVVQSDIEAYVWFALAASRGNADARENRDLAASENDAGGVEEGAGAVYAVGGAVGTLGGEVRVSHLMGQRQSGAYVERSDTLNPEAFKLLHEALIRGQFERGDVQSTARFRFPKRTCFVTDSRTHAGNAVPSHLSGG